jgi:uncharacterized protein YbaP (TraB family)
MKKLFIFFLFLSCIPGFSQNSVLWRITGNGLKEPSYLFGTIHVMPAKFFVINDSVKKCFDQSSMLVMEMETKIPLGEQIRLLQEAFFPGRKTLRDYMDSASFNHYCNYLRDSLKIKERLLKRYIRFKPAFMDGILVRSYVRKPKMYELEFRKMAGKKKSFLPLESASDQMSVIDSLPIEKQLPDADYKPDKEYYQLLDIYLKQDLNALDSMMNVEADEQTETIMLNNRNSNWIPKLKDAMSVQSCFIAVGCGHLAGKYGLIRMLQKEGYRLEAVVYKNNEK